MVFEMEHLMGIGERAVVSVQQDDEVEELKKKKRPHRRT